MKMELKKIYVLLTCAFTLSGVLHGMSFSDAGSGLSKLMKKDPLQKRYEKMSSSVPAVAVLETKVFSGVSEKNSSYVDELVQRKMVEGGKLKPVNMRKWLDCEYGNRKSPDVFSLIGELSRRQYEVNLQALLKTEMFQSGDQIFLMMILFPFKAKGFPVYSFRVIEKSDFFEDVDKVVECCIDDLAYLLEKQKSAGLKIAVLPLDIDCRILVEQRSGQFDFIKSSFSMQNGIELNSDDDYVSSLISYFLTATRLCDGCPVHVLQEYACDGGSAALPADYVIGGKLELNNRMNVLTLTVTQTSSGRNVFTGSFFLEDMSCGQLWKAMEYFVNVIVEKTVAADKYMVVPELHSGGRSFYFERYFLGTDRLFNVVLPGKNVVVNTGRGFSADVSFNADIMHSKSSRDYFVYYDRNMLKIFKGRKGEFAWNLLEK